MQNSTELLIIDKFLLSIHGAHWLRGSLQLPEFNYDVE